MGATGSVVGIAVLLGYVVLLAACAPSGSGQSAPGVAASAIAASPSRAVASPDLGPVGVTETARVVRIVDGDTIVIDRGRGKEKVRYIGMNTPETVRPNSPVEFMGKEASAANAALVEGRTVTLEQDVSDTDQYGRLLRYVWVNDGAGSSGLTMVNLALVQQGFAQADTWPPDVRYADLLVVAQRAARDQGLGLWGPETPAP